MIHTRMLIAATVCSFALLSGCASLGKWITPANVPIMQEAVDVAVATMLSRESNPKYSAGKIKVIAQEILAMDKGSSATLTAVEAALNAKIAALDLPPADAAAAMVLSSTLEAVLNAKIASSPENTELATVQVTVAAIANAVITATSYYGV